MEHSKEQLQAALIAADKAGDTAAAQQLANALRSYTAPEDKVPQRVSGSVADAAGQGVFAGLSDEITGGIGAIGSYLDRSPEAQSAFKDLSFGERYSQVRDQARAQNKEYTEENPATALAATLAGGLLTGGVGVARTGATTLGGVAARGAGVGAVGGFGAGEGDAVSQLGSTAGGALIGGALAPALPALSAGLSRLKDPVNQTTKRFNKLLSRDEMTPEQLGARLDELGPEATIADAGGANIKAAAETMAQMPGRAMQRANELVEARQLGQAGRVTDSLDEVLGNGQSLFQAEQTIMKNLQTKAAPLYQQANEVPITLTSEMRDILARPLGQQAMQSAQRMAANEGHEFGADAFTSGTVPTKLLDYVKRGIDDVVESNTNIAGKVNNEGRIAANMAKTLRESVDKQNPTYKAARDVYAGDSASQAALKEGQKFLRENAERTSFNMTGKSESEREMFRLGALQTLRDRALAKSDTADSVKGLFNSPGMREKIKAIVPDEAQFNALAQKMEAESEFFRTGSQMLGNSATARRLLGAQDQGLANVGGMALEAAAGNPMMAAAKAGLGRLAQTPETRSEPVRNMLSEYLMSQHPIVQQQLMQGLQGTQAPLRAGLGAVSLPAAQAVQGQR